MVGHLEQISSASRKRKRDEELTQGQVLAILIIASQIDSLVHLLASLRKERVQGQYWVLPRSTHWYQATWRDELYNTMPSCWRLSFRLSRQTFRLVRDALTPLLAKQNTRFREAVDPEKRIFIGLYVLAHEPATCDVIGKVFGVGAAIVSDILEEFCDALIYTFRTDSAFPSMGLPLRGSLMLLKNTRIVLVL